MRTLLLAGALAALALPAFGQTNSAVLAATPATVGTGSGQVSSAHTRRHLELLNQSATATIYCTLDGSAPIASATGGQVTLPPLGGAAWSMGVIPANAITCIATGSGTPLTVVE